MYDQMPGMTGGNKSHSIIDIGVLAAEEIAPDVFVEIQEGLNEYVRKGCGGCF